MVMTIEKSKPKEKGNICLEEKLTPIRVRPFCQTFDRALFSSIKSKMGQTISARRSSNVTDSVYKS